MGEQEGCTSLRGLKRPMVPVICLEGGKHCQARQGAHTLDPEVLSFSYFLNFETFRTPIKVEGACREHHVSLT